MPHHHDSTLAVPSVTSTGRAVLIGAAAGAAATLAMSGAMLMLQRMGFLGRMPPRLIVERSLTRLGVRRATSRGTHKALSSAAHLGFGASQGALYALGHSLAAKSGREVTPTLGTAVPFALAVWAVSYVGWLPKLGIMPPPSRDRPGRPTSMIFAHLVYGAALATVLRRTLARGRAVPASPRTLP
jgi:hypothetical protein